MIFQFQEIFVCLNNLESQIALEKYESIRFHDISSNSLQESKSPEKSPQKEKSPEKSIEKSPKTEISVEKSPKTEKSAEKSPSKTPKAKLNPFAAMMGKSPAASEASDSNKPYEETIKKSKYDPIEDAIWKKDAKTPYLAFAKTLQVIK